MSGPRVETAIWFALKGRVQTLPASIVPQTSIAWPKVPFTKPQGGTPPKPLPYIEVRLLPNRVQRLFIGSAEPHRRPGILQLDFMAPTTGLLDDVQVIEMAGDIAAHFPADLRLTAHGVTVRIQQAPDVLQGFADGAYWRVPVSIRYDCYA
jgi:hypothetical protein